ncbi:MAG: class I SAM-dependent rRNA methyltransferase [candidate division Zixibacteria bacterium]|nr:class I SAM-dependent rRNA methyltransferase [candidate division Zixibacteria bacterium]
MEKIRLKRNEDKRIREGHLWVFSNEIDELIEAKGEGEVVEVHDSRGGFLAKGYYNRHSLIAIRVLTYEKDEKIDGDFFFKRIEQALKYRHRIYPQLSSYRVVYSEGDFLPGLIIDRYEKNLVLQILTLGMEKFEAEIIKACEKLFLPARIVLRNDTSFRELESLVQGVKIVKGDIESPALIEEFGLKFFVDLKEGQKTGFFFDQKENRLMGAIYAKGRKVLDCFCYTGAWGIASTKNGAKGVLGIDSSEKSLELAQKNAKLNEVEKLCTFVKGDSFDVLRGLVQKNEKFDMVILDPPAFVKSKSKLVEGMKGYKEINLQALKLLDKGGILISCSCSHNFSKDLFMEMLKSAAKDAHKTLRLIEFRTQAKDHPILLSMPETEYLKCAILEVV